MDMNTWNEKLNKRWSELSKTVIEVGSETANETAGAAATALMALSKDLEGLGHRLERWVESGKKPEDEASKPGA